MLFFALIDFSPDCSELRSRMAHIAVFFEDPVFVVVFKHRQRVLARCLKTKLLQLYHKMGLEVENLDDVYLRFERSELADCKQVLESLVSGGELVMLTPQLCIERRIYEDIWEKTKQHFAEHGELTLAEFRDMLGNHWF